MGPKDGGEAAGQVQVRDAKGRDLMDLKIMKNSQDQDINRTGKAPTHRTSATVG